MFILQSDHQKGSRRKIRRRSTKKRKKEKSSTQVAKKDNIPNLAIEDIGTDNKLDVVSKPFFENYNERLFQKECHELVKIALESNNSEIIDHVIVLALGRMVHIGIRNDNPKILLEVLNHGKEIKINDIRDNLFNSLSKGFFSLAWFHYSFDLATKSLEAINMIQNPRKIPHKVLEANIDFFEHPESQRSPELLTNFALLLETACGKLGRIDLFIQAARSLLRISGYEILQAMQCSLDQTFQLWEKTADTRLIEHALTITELLVTRTTLSDEKTHEKRNSHLESLVNKLIEATINITDPDLLERALKVTQWITDEDIQNKSVLRIVTQLSLLGHSTEDSALLDRAKELIDSDSLAQKSESLDEEKVRDFIRDLDDKLLKWEQKVNKV